MIFDGEGKLCRRSSSASISIITSPKAKFEYLGKVRFLPNMSHNFTNPYPARTEQAKAELYKTGASFGWNLEELEKQNKLKILYFDVVETDGFLEKIYEAYTNFLPKRVVIDSLTTLSDSLLVSGINEKQAFSMVQIAESVSPIPRTERIVAKNLLYHLYHKKCLPTTPSRLR